MTPTPSSYGRALPSPETSIQVAAEFYENALGLTPIRVNGKVPVDEAWPTLPYEPDVWESWNGNIGVVIGPMYVVIDVDDADAWTAFVAGRELPETLTQRSPRPGRHLFFKIDGREPLTNRKLAKGVDVRAGAGQVVVCPSRGYEWTVGGNAEHLPVWLYDEIKRDNQTRSNVVPIRRSNAAARAAAYIAKMPDSIQGESGGDALFAVCRTLLDFGLSEEEAWPYVHEYNRARCKPEWSQKEMDHKMEDAADRRVVRDLAGAPRSERQAGRPEAPEPEPGAPKRAPGSGELVLFRGKPAKTLLNATILWPKLGTLRRNLLSLGTEWNGHQITDADLRAFRVWAQDAHAVEFDTGIASDAADHVAAENPYDPLVEYLRSLVWDGLPRIDTWLPDFFGSVNTIHARRMGRWFLLGAAARGLVPGTKVDTSLVLEGPPGSWKSTAVRVLAGYEFSMSSNQTWKRHDIAGHWAGSWIIELAEMSALLGVEAEHAIALLTQTEDRFRLPWARRDETWPRRHVFIGTTNRQDWMTDDRMARRFNAVWVKACNLERLAAARDQLWAEAVARYDAGEKWYPANAKEAAEMEEEAGMRVPVDSWDDDASKFLATRDTCRSSDLAAALGIAKDRRIPSIDKRLREVFLRLGWVKSVPNKRERIEGAISCWKKGRGVERI